MLLSCVNNLFSQTESETIKKAKDLISIKKYESAFKLLDKYDPNNSKPDMVLLKEEIVLNYFVSSMMHQLFALKDLKEKEEIKDFRGKEGKFGMQMFEIDKILDSLIQIYPNNCKLYKGLGDYYYEVHLKYGENWLKKESELKELIEKNYLKSINENCADYLPYYVLGYLKTAKEQYKDALAYYKKSIELNNNYPSAQYNLAYSYLYLDERDSALIYAKKSLEMYEDIEYKSDAARMVAQIYLELNDDKKALQFFENANEIDPENYYNLKPILKLYLKTNHPKTNYIRSSLFNLYAGNPTIYNDLEEIYIKNKKEIELIKFYKEQLEVKKNNLKVFGNLNFYLAKFYTDTDKKLAKNYFITAKNSFAKVLKPNHEIFQIINDEIKQLEK